MSIPMRRLCSLVLLGLALACSDRAPMSRSPAPSTPVRSRNSGFGTVVSVERVHITQGFTVWRDGEELTAHEGLLVGLDGLHPLDFLPMNIGPPLFVLGDSVGLMLRPPSSLGPTMLLMAPQPPDTEVALYMSYPGALPEHLKGTALKSLQETLLSANAHGGVNVRIPPADAPKTPYPTLYALEDTLMTRKASPELCAGVGKECGHLSQTTLGGMDCGECPSGKVCDLSNRCCTPTTCEARGLTCGYAADGCGGSLDCGFCFRP